MTTATTGRILLYGSIYVTAVGGEWTALQAWLSLGGSAILLVLKESGSIPRGALVQAAANNVGHRRVGTRIRTAFESVLDGLLRERRVRELGDRLALP